MGNSQCCQGRGSSSNDAEVQERDDWSQRPSPRAALDGVQESGSHTNDWRAAAQSSREGQRHQQQPRGLSSAATPSTANPLVSPPVPASPPGAREGRMAQLRQEAEARAAQVLSQRGVRRASRPPPRNNNGGEDGGSRNFNMQSTTELPQGGYGMLQTVDPPSFSAPDEAHDLPGRSYSEDNFSLASAGSSMHSFSQPPDASQGHSTVERRNLFNTGGAPANSRDPMEADAASSHSTNSVLERSFEASTEQDSAPVPLTRKNSFDQYLRDHVRQLQQTRRPMWFRGSARPSSMEGPPTVEARLKRTHIRFKTIVDSSLGDDVWWQKRANSVGHSDSPGHLLGATVTYRVQLAKKLAAVDMQEFVI